MSAIPTYNELNARAKSLIAKHSDKFPVRLAGHIISVSECQLYMLEECCEGEEPMPFFDNGVDLEELSDGLDSLEEKLSLIDVILDENDSAKLTVNLVCEFAEYLANEYRPEFPVEAGGLLVDSIDGGLFWGEADADDDEITAPIITSEIDVDCTREDLELIYAALKAKAE